MHYVYILYSKKLKKRYIGSTEDLKQRLKDHEKGTSVYTKKGRPWRLIYCEIFINKFDAQEEERFLKSGQGRQRLKFLLKQTMEKLA